MKFTCYRTAGGQITSRLEMPSLEAALLNVASGEWVVLGEFDPAGFWIDHASGTAIPKPVPPGPWAEFNYVTKLWFDPRDPVEELANSRGRATISRLTFLAGCVETGILSQEDALFAAKGEIPANMNMVISQLPEISKFEAKLRWAALTEIDRMDPLILAIAEGAGVPDAVLDHIFRVQPLQS